MMRKPKITVAAFKLLTAPLLLKSVLKKEKKGQVAHRCIAQGGSG